MKREDERILEYLDAEKWATPDIIAQGAFEKVSPGHIRERLYFLSYAGMVAQFGMNSWELAQNGKKYLDGSIDAEHLPTPTVDRVLQGKQVTTSR